MGRKKKIIPEYRTAIMNGIEYYRTRIVDADGKRVAIYAKTPEELYEKVQKAKQEIKQIHFRKEYVVVDHIRTVADLHKQIFRETVKTEISI